MRFFWPLTKKRARPPKVPSGTRVYAVGDIHGRDDLLEALLDGIASEVRTRKAARTILLFLGDYIDRGPSSRAVIERLDRLRRADPNAHFLLGNHEEALLRVLNGDSSPLADWLRFGGVETLASYGVEAAEIASLGGDQAVRRVRAAFPKRHVEFLEACDDSFAVGDYMFVHAGIRPGVPLAAQAQSDLRWIRAPFLDSQQDHGAVVVHGHTISENVEWRANRIGVDTGAYATGRLTALALEGERRWTIEAVERDTMLSVASAPAAC